MNGSNPLIRYQALIEVGGFDEKLPPAEDWDMWLKLANHYHFVVVKSPQVLYRQSSLSASSNVLKMEKASLMLLKNALNYRPNSLKNISNTALGNLYKYLTWKALVGIPKKDNCFTAIRFLYCAVKYHPRLVFKKAFLKVISRIILLLILPPQLATISFNQLKSMTDHTTLLGYIKVEVS